MPQLSLFSLCLGFFGQVASHFLTSRSFEVLHGLLMVWTYFIEFFFCCKPIVSSCFQSTFFTSFFFVTAFLSHVLVSNARFRGPKILVSGHLRIFSLPAPLQQHVASEKP